MSPFLHLKEALVGAFWVGGILLVFLWCFKSNVRVIDVLPGAMAGAVIGYIPTLFFPKGFSLPRDITTITHQAISAFCLWVAADGLVKGEIHGIDNRRILRAFVETVSWKNDPIVFWTYLLVWSVIGSISLAIPIFYFSKAIHDTSPPISSPRESAVLRAYNKWKELPENFQAIFVFTIALSSILSGDKERQRFRHSVKSEPRSDAWKWCLALVICLTGNLVREREDTATNAK
jgi:hypothetical protein